MPSRTSLRLRLTLLFMLLFAVAYAGVLASAWVLYQDTARRSLDRQLLNLAQGTASDIQNSGVGLEHLDLRQFQPADRQFSILAVRDQRGRVVVARPAINTAVLPELSTAGDSPRVQFHDADELGGPSGVGQWLFDRAITFRFIGSGGAPLYLDIARTTSLVESEGGIWFDVLVAGSFGALAAATLAVWLIAGRVVAPFRQLAHAAREVGPEHLDARLHVPASSVEVDDLQSELNAALERLETGYRSQRKFISNVAHDLKTPIAVMLTESQAFTPQAATLEEIEAYQSSVIQEMRRLGRLIAGFLTLARAEQEEALARHVVVPVNDIIVDSVSLCGLESRQRIVRLVPTLYEASASDPSPELFGDPDLLRTMLDNIIRNAIRFSPPGGSIEIRSGIDRECAFITVRDHGPGVPPDMVERLFQPFVQAQPGERRGGTGLGLAIARTVAEGHGGAIQVENCADEGCMFTITLPLHAPVAEHGEAGELDAVAPQ